MFGISGAEFLVILIVAIAVIPAKDWPSVARALAGLVKAVRQIIWKITDATEQIKEQVERELPIDEIVRKTTDDVASAFAAPVKRKTKDAYELARRERRERTSHTNGEQSEQRQKTK
jgi:Sec-independent protein translocase protein TatA